MFITGRPLDDTVPTHTHTLWYVFVHMVHINVYMCFKNRFEMYTLNVAAILWSTHTCGKCCCFSVFFHRYIYICAYIELVAFYDMHVWFICIYIYLYYNFFVNIHLHRWFIHCTAFRCHAPNRTVVSMEGPSLGWMGCDFKKQHCSKLLHHQHGTSFFLSA